MKHYNTLGCHGNAMEVVFLDKLDPGCKSLLGSFKVPTNKVVATNDGKPLPLYEKALCGVIAGAIGATVGSPPIHHSFVCASNATLPPLDAELQKCFPCTILSSSEVRAMTLNMEMLASYDQSVEFFKDFHGLGEASTQLDPILFGFFASAFSLPFDYVKTQI
ncbi:hypothetical protein AAG906_001793 [Vitis piasezkii]